MDTITSIFITVIANAVITGVIVFFIQKKFEANLQKSLYAYQTRFSRNYEKSVETLESLYQKLAVYFQDVTQTAAKYIASTHLGRKELIESARNYYGDRNPHLEEFFKYFQEGRLFLPSDSVPKIMNVYFDVAYLHLLIPYALQIDESVNPMESYKFANDLIAMANLKISKINIEEPHWDLTLKEILTEIEMRVLILEALYRSAAEAK